MSKSLVQSFIAAAILLGLIFLDSVGVMNFAIDGGRKTAEILDVPFVAVFGRVKNFFEVVSTLKDLSGQNDVLAQQVQVLTAQVASLEKESQENRILRDALGFQAQTKLDLVPAEVISLDPFSPDHRITLNRGARQGVGEGSAVVIAGNILVGVIVSVSEETSQIDAVTSSQVTINAQTSTGKATGVVRGEHGVGLLMDLISQTDVIAKGDKIITSGLGGTYTKGLLIGTVGEVSSSSSELFQKANVIPAADLKQLSVVFIVKK